MKVYSTSLAIKRNANQKRNEMTLHTNRIAITEKKKLN